jgi:hypothetical protein
LASSIRVEPVASGFNSSVRAATRLLHVLIACVALAAMASAQAFGRFGYVEPELFSGIRFARDSFAADHPAAEKIRFVSPLTAFRPVQTSEFGQTVWLGDPEPGKPSKLRLSLFVPGIALHFEQGVRLLCQSTSAPYLTWGQGSVADGVPTPVASWLGLSFRDRQPAFVLGMPSGGHPFQVSGSPGAWEISSPTFTGWLRIALPRGRFAEPTNTAASLGRLATACREGEVLFTRMAPELLGFQAEADADGSGVTGVWTFSDTGFLIPQALTLARLGGYLVTVQSKSRRVARDVGAGEGPRDLSESRELRVRFPVRRVPVGRGLAIGEPRTPIGTISHHDIPSVVELAFENMLAGRDAESRRVAEAAFAGFLAEATFLVEPYSNQTLTFAADGMGIDLTAAHALLSQALTTSTQPTSTSNALLTSIRWRRDWNTWLPWVDDSARRRRAAALAALAGALCAEPERRVDAGMFQAGLAGERGLEVWRRRTGSVSEAMPLLEPLLGVRSGIFRTTLPVVSTEPYVAALLSPVRIFSPESVRANQDESGLRLEWPVLEPKGGTMSIAASTPLELEALANLPRFLTERVLGLTEVRYTPEAAGLCQVRVKLPDFAPALPKLSPPPAYSEPRL